MVMYDCLFGLVLSAVGICVCVISLGFRSPYYTFSLGLFLSFLSMVLVYKGFRKGFNVNIKNFQLTNSWKKVALTIIIMFIYILCLKPLGFVLASVTFMMVLMWVLNYRHYIQSFIISVPTVLFVYYFFTRVIHVTLPAGILPL